jgi:ribonuclease P protein component
MSPESKPGSKPATSKLATPNQLLRLRKHADYQRVYGSSKKQFSKQIAFFYSLRPLTGPDGKVHRSETMGPRIGLTVGKVMGKAVDRNRIKRRMRECIRRSAGLITAPVDVVLHPRRVVIDIEFASLEREVAQVFRTIQAAIDKQAGRQIPSGATNVAEGGEGAQSQGDGQRSRGARVGLP